MTEALKRNHVDIHDEIYSKLDGLSALLNEKITLAQAEYHRCGGAFSENQAAELERLENERLTDEMIRESARKNNWESFVGLNLLNKLGIFLIIIGVIAASRFTYFKLPDMFKGIVMFLLGAAMLLGGELFNRRRANTFSLGITAGGIAVLYTALGVSYFSFEILGMYAAVVLCILITAVAFLLALRYNAQVILAFSLIGGYLPLFAVGADKAVIFGAMVYFIVLNLLALLISFKKKWTASAFIGLFLNIAGTFYITIIQITPQAATAGYKAIVIFYVLFAFLTYSLIPIMSSCATGQKFKTPEIVLLAINTFFSSLIMYVVLYEFDMDNFCGLLSLGFAVIYLALSFFAEKRLAGDKRARALFYLTGFAFAALTVPFQFGRAWLTLGWLAEGVLLTAYGIAMGDRGFKKVGFVIYGLCIAAFLIVDILWSADYLFAYKYLAITLGAVVILAGYTAAGAFGTKFEKGFKYLTIVNLWIYSVYAVTVELSAVIELRRLDKSYICSALAVAVTFLIACVAPRIKKLYDKGVAGISVGIYIIGIIRLAYINQYDSPFIHGIHASAAYTAVGTVVLLIISVLSLFALYDVLRCIVLEKKLGVGWIPFILSAYFVLILTQNLITQYELSFTSFAISVIYVITALAWILRGFIKRCTFLRRFGLGLSVLSVIKLFLLDIGSLTQGYKIVSYFVLGVTLVVISFVYQYFNKRLELTVNVKEGM